MKVFESSLEPGVLYMDLRFVDTGIRENVVFEVDIELATLQDIEDENILYTVFEEEWEKFGMERFMLYLHDKDFRDESGFKEVAVSISNRRPIFDEEVIDDEVIEEGLDLFGAP